MRWSGSDLLHLWDSGSHRTALERALLMLGGPAAGDALLDMPLAERDRALLALRRDNFGALLPGCTDCPACGMRLEFDLDADALRGPPPPSRIAAGALTVRLPTSRDLAAALREPDAHDAARVLAARCIVAPAAGAEALDDARLALVEQALAQADGGDTVLALCCAHCGHAWRDSFDIAAYLWQEIAARARALLRDIDTIARAYGWNEHDVLALSDTRRAAYVAMVTA